MGELNITHTQCAMGTGTVNSNVNVRVSLIPKITLSDHLNDLCAVLPNADGACLRRIDPLDGKQLNQYELLLTGAEYIEFHSMTTSIKSM